MLICIYVYKVIGHQYMCTVNFSDLKNSFTVLYFIYTQYFIKYYEIGLKRGYRKNRAIYGLKLVKSYFVLI